MQHKEDDFVYQSTENVTVCGYKVFTFMLPDLINKIYTLSFEGLWLWSESLYDNMSIHVTSISNINNGDAVLMNVSQAGFLSLSETYVLLRCLCRAHGPLNHMTLIFSLSRQLPVLHPWSQNAPLCILQLTRLYILLERDLLH